MNKELHHCRNDQSYVGIYRSQPRHPEGIILQGTQGERDDQDTSCRGCLSRACDPAAAQATFYIVQDTTTKRCTIVKERPTTTTMVVVGDSGKVYTTEAEAQAAIRTIKVCESK